MKLVRHAYNALSLKKELQLLFKNKKNITGIVDFDTMLLPHSELSQGNYTKIENLKNFLSIFKVSANIITKPIYCSGNPNANVVFINGICSSFEMAQYQARTISKMINRDVELAYNKTDGFLLDLVECFQDRLENEYSKAAVDLAKIITEKLIIHDEVILFGYSQGTIITAKTMTILNTILDQKLKEKIKVFNFAPACNSYSVKDIHTEYFINNQDPVCRIGYIEFQDKIEGIPFTREKSGHLLVADYLHSIKDFDNFDESYLSKIII